jgi:hypothetical protein
MMTGEEPFTDPSHYAASRFGMPIMIKRSFLRRSRQNGKVGAESSLKLSLKASFLISASQKLVSHPYEAGTAAFGRRAADTASRGGWLKLPLSRPRFQLATSWYHAEKLPI